MGAYRYIQPRLATAMRELSMAAFGVPPRALHYIGRPAAASAGARYAFPRLACQSQLVIRSAVEATCMCPLDISRCICGLCSHGVQCDTPGGDKGDTRCSPARRLPEPMMVSMLVGLLALPTHLHRLSSNDQVMSVELSLDSISKGCWQACQPA